jgi:hypothetical protein
MSDEVPITGGTVKDCKWSYERGLLDDSGNVKTVVLAQLALTGAKYQIDGKPVSHATVRFGPTGSAKSSADLMLSVSHSGR